METYAVFFKTSTTIPGDQRSRDCPGHGYSEHTVEHNEYIEFKTKDEFFKWVTREEGKIYGRVAYRAVKCTPIKIETKTTIDIG